MYLRWSTWFLFLYSDQSACLIYIYKLPQVCEFDPIFDYYLIIISVLRTYGVNGFLFTIALPSL